MSDLKHEGIEDRSEMKCIDRSFRAFSKKFRVYIFREFLLETFGDYLSSSSDAHSVLRNESSDDEIIVLDIAGGKGDLSWLLTHVDGIRSIVLDPRPSGTNNHIQRTLDFLLANPEECQIRAMRDRPTYQPLAALMPKLLQNPHHNNLKRAEHMQIYVNQALVDAVRTAIDDCGSKLECLKRLKAGGENSIESWNKYWKNVCPLDIENGDSNHPCRKDDGQSIQDSNTALDVILRCRLIAGFHPDQATDASIDLAKLLGIPFAIVPCCVFPSDFRHRKIWYKALNFGKEEFLYCQPAQNEVDTSNLKTKPVKKYHDLLVYLKQQHPEVKSHTLPFEGTITAKNLALYTLPER